MNAMQTLRQIGQSLWLDNITRPMLDDGTLAAYIRDFALTGLTSNPTIFEHAIGNSNANDEAITCAASRDVSTPASTRRSARHE